VTALQNGGFVVTWEDYSQSGGDTDNYAIRAQVYQADGTTTGSEFLVNTTTSSNQIGPSVTGLQNGGFVVTWQDDSASGGDTSGSAIRAQIYQADGTTTGSEFLVNTTTSSNQSYPSATALQNGGFVVTWQDDSASGGDTSNSAIRAQIYSVVPDTLSPADLLAISDTGTSNTDNITSSTTQQLSGSATSGDTVSILVGGTTVNTVTAAGGSWSYTHTLTAGSYDITVLATDTAGNAGAASTALGLVVDTTAPTTLAAPDLLAASDAGASAAPTI
jgi:hypothetical protein